MLARLFVKLPFNFTIPEGIGFTMYEETVNDYRVRYFPPLWDKRTVRDEDMTIHINGVQCVSADVLKVDFVKKAFDRTENSTDPPLEIMEAVVNSLLRRIRHTGMAHPIHEIDLKSENWHLDYLTEDERELEPEAGLIRGRGARSYELKYNALTPDIWDHALSLPFEFKGRLWEQTILDAVAQMPEIDTSIVLASTAVEVFISEVLSILAERSPVPEILWKWIVHRNANPLKQPSLKEQYDVLLESLCGHSLVKEHPNVWEKLANMQTGRNNVVHEGKAIHSHGRVVTKDEMAGYILAAKQTFEIVEAWMPADLQVKPFRTNLKVEMRKRIRPATSPAQSE